MTVNFYLNNKANKDNTYTLMGYIYGGNSRVSFKTSIKIKPENWNKEKQNVKIQAKNSFQYNQMLHSLRNSITEFEKAILIENPHIPHNLLIKIIKDKIISFNDIKTNPTNQLKDFFDLFDDFLIFQSNSGFKKPIRKSTLNVYKSLKAKLSDFQSYIQTNIELEKINNEFLNSYVNFLITKKNNSQNTVSKSVKLLKTFLKWSYEYGHLKSSDFQKFSKAEVPTNIIVLTLDELESLEKLELNDISLERVRDSFLFGCYTGQRFEDIVKFKFDSIHNNTWSLVTSKTNDIISIPLIDSALSLIEKYKSMGYNSFPMISNQKTNKKLKTIAKMAEINQMTTIIKYLGNQRIETHHPKYEIITFHISRKTFITLSLIKGITVPIVQKISGHKDYKTMSKYIDIADQVVAKEITNAWNNR